MKKGDLVNVRTFSDGVVERRVVEIVKDTVYVCTDEEWRLASGDNREPSCAGFNKEYVSEIRNLAPQE